MRVLAVGNVYPPHALGGYEIVWRGVMQQLRELHHEARVLTTDHRAPDVPPSATEDPEVYRELQWYWHEHEWPKLRLRQQLKLERHNAAVFDRHVAEFAPDVITWWPMGGMSLSLIERSRRSGLRSLLFIHDYWPIYGARRDLWTHTWSSHPYIGRIVDALTGIPTSQCLEHAGRWLFNSEWVRQRVQGTGLKIDDSGVLSPGIERSFVTEQPGGTQRTWSWRLLYIGRVVEQKGVHTAIEALAQLPPMAELRIVGDGDRAYRKRLDSLTGTLGLGDRVRFEPPRSGSALRQTYQEADAIVFPVEWNEPWGLVPLEAMALGRPVIATGRGGSGEYLRHGVNSLLFDAGDPAALAGALRRLAADEGLRERLHREGLLTARRHTEDEFNRRAVLEITNAARR